MAAIFVITGNTAGIDLVCYVMSGVAWGTDAVFDMKSLTQSTLQCSVFS